MGPFVFSCKQCSQTFVSSKTLRSHKCDDDSDVRSDGDEKAKIISHFDLPSIEIDKIERTEDKKPGKCKIEQRMTDAFTEEVEQKIKPETMVAADTSLTTNNENEILKVKKEEDEKYICPLCKKYMPSLASLDIHTRIHEFDAGSISCPIQDCWNNFTHKKQLTEHMHSFHGDFEKKWTAPRFKCKDCDKIFDRQDGLKRHMIKHSQERNFLCTLCPKKFKNRDSLKFHKRRHDGELNYACEHCEKRFVNWSTLKVHIKDKHEISTDIFTCDQCHKEYNKKEKLKNHMTLHTGEKPYKCREVCDKAFRSRVPREDHERQHRGVKEFQCTRCPKMFMKAGGLRVHMKRHEGRKDHQCATCGKAFVEPAGARNCKHSGR